jgi:hypothetical protein
VGSAAQTQGKVGESSDEVMARELQRQFDEEAAMLASTSATTTGAPPSAPPNAGNSLF